MYVSGLIIFTFQNKIDQMSFSFVELFSIFGGFLGLVLLLIILVKLKGKPIVKFSLAMFLLICSAIVIIGTITFSGNIIYFPHLFRLDSPLHYLFGPVCFFYTLASFKTDFRFRYIQLLNLLPFLINLVEFMPFYFSSASAKIEHYNSLIETGKLILPLHSALKATIILVYLILQFYVFYKYKPKNILENKSQLSLVSWFTIFLTVQTILLVGLLVNIATGFKLFADPYRYAVFIESLYVYSVTIALLFFPSLLYGNVDDKIIQRIILKEKYSHSKLTDEEKIKILNDLTAYLKSENKPFLNPALSMVEVARILKVTPQQLSQVVNEKTNLNFTNYINSYRIERAKEILSSLDFSRHTIDSIDEMAGFQSKSPFYLAFKKHTGMTPKEFISSTGDKSAVFSE
jgi:AraC-like DNA-binding protein